MVWEFSINFVESDDVLDSASLKSLLSHSLSCPVWLAQHYIKGHNQYQQKVQSVNRKTHDKRKLTLLQVSLQSASSPE